MKKNVLLINLGTPTHHNAINVYRYLTEFLNDKRVVDLPAFIRWPLINFLVIPTRYRQSMKAYKMIWEKTGSPLLHHSMQLKEALSEELGPFYQVELGMRYGKPSIEDALDQFQDRQELILLPLFPHYSSAATGSALAECLRILAKQWVIPTFSIKKDFYAHAGFIDAYTQVIKEHLNNQLFDLLLFSYHGLPERHLEKSFCKASCNKKSHCPGIHSANNYCYRSQCYETSRLVAKKLQLSNNQYEVSFQSRLGRIPWIKPYTDHILAELRKKEY